MLIQRIPACRYDDAEWSDCDPFEMIRFRTMRLISGGRQCEEIKNITKHCTADELPPGTKWLIAEHRKCIAELKRLDRACNENSGLRFLCPTGSSARDPQIIPCLVAWEL